jgi:hypothetical protein
VSPSHPAAAVRAAVLAVAQALPVVDRDDDRTMVASLLRHPSGVFGAVERVALGSRPTADHIAHLRTARWRMGHQLYDLGEQCPGVVQGTSAAPEPRAEWGGDTR